MMAENKRYATIAWLIVMAIGLVAVLAFLTYQYGRGGRGYFSPDTLRMRTQREFLIPLVNVPVWRSRYDVHQQPLVTFLKEEGYWSPTNNEPPRWILAFHWNDHWWDGDLLWHKELVRDEFWIQWTIEHPDMARVVWPLVIQTLRTQPDGEHYAGNILRCASVTENTREFELLISGGRLPNK
ncbi:MAG: hypothetical protein R3C10_02375 [Pirellulales bacterium]